MRGAYIINSVEGGGAALPVPDVTRVMREAGHEVTVLALTRRDGKAVAPMEAAGLEVRVRAGGRTDHLAALRWLDAEIARLRPTHLWTSLSRATLLGQIVGARRGVPVISWQHSARLKPANARLLRLFRNRSQLWIADSASVAAQTRATLGIAPDRLAIWPIFRADPAFPTALPWRSGEPVRIGSLGRLHPVKNYDVLCAAVALLRQRSDLPPFSVVIGGEGEERARLEGLIARDGLPVTLAGYVADPAAFLTGLHLYTQPSRWEGFCLAAHEAMLAGLPIVASEAGEIARTVTPAFGRIVPPGDARALADALAGLLRAPDQLAAKGRTARARVLDLFNAENFEAQGRAILARAADLT
ncbi:glycosyltransferase [Acidomonas methanolica]|uniref:Glycosyl transferase group 1 n=2 Tax=Acidomonas methanolica TaxID=437 RepID=A0A023D417_ACIMT|nr:glycosyltransferase [Acidomonas methanolica]MBU2654512.1 glycosyltransferase [Acidomonas methanolica]TCS28315.1 glycosyltransferase involved in cell wall biosynthesis [Acidomonas methanolica]GAJ28551.1 glycosyl transferase group 1 [Acidomonas methanolica NBRC 104435]GEK99032.1 hypothetical protein AME01nite_15310 [Acidomonas methanolica NBRC 104435]